MTDLNSKSLPVYLAPSTWVLCVLVLVIVVLDLWTKSIATAYLHYGQQNEVLPVLNWTLLHNKGAAFSFLSDQGGWQRYLFTSISAVASVMFIVWLYRLPKQQWLVRYSLTFILGGAIGNLIDRIQHGHVVDFISVHWNNNYFPAFNIADMAITFGAILMIADMVFNPEHKKKAVSDSDS